MPAANDTSAVPLPPEVPPVRRVLLRPIGMSPRIGTEALYALAVNPPADQAVWVPTEVHVLTAARGVDSARLNLRSSAPVGSTSFAAIPHCPTSRLHRKTCISFQMQRERRSMTSAALPPHQWGECALRASLQGMRQSIGGLLSD
jgi:hypothetical protein